MSTAIEIRGLNHFYGQGRLKKQTLFDINLMIEAGEIVIMTGPSGSGKTTLLSLMGCLRSVQSGSLKILGTQLYGASGQKQIETRRHIGYIFQAHNLLTFLTAEENVILPTELTHISPGVARQRAREMLRLVGLGERMNYYPDNLSGGQRQRVAIARALINEPRIILADEPTAALDKQSGRDVVELIRKLAREKGCAIVLVTHDNRILDIADRIVEMEDGYLTLPEAINSELPYLRDTRNYRESD